jgi:class 3 adenylate cyclase/CHASE3 domain sensor protein
MSSEVSASTAVVMIDTSADDLGPLPRILRPVVDLVARARATVHVKLLAGFLAIALLLFLMGVVSIVVLARVNQQVETLTTLDRQTNQAREMIYDVTAQSHFRAMTLLTHDPEYIQKLDAAKADFAAGLAEIRTYAIPPREQLFDDLAAVNATFSDVSDEVTALYDAGKLDQALHLHIDREHPISHQLEDPLNRLIAQSQELATAETNSFRAHRTFLTFAVATFSGLSVLVALTLGAILSWSLIRPVRRVDHALEDIAGGNFQTRVDVPNRDEFGNLTKNLNRTTENLSTLYQRLESLNENLRDVVDAKVAELERANRLKRYLSPGVAESVLAGERDVELAPSRKFLTTFFSDIRGFTEAAEQMAPEELVMEMNDYLSEMTDIVFKYGGTLDKYVGDALMVFFGDPLPQDDHALRAVRMALEMRERMTELEEHWLTRYDEVFRSGIGISTGWVTVGDIGSRARSDYTVLGKEVNLAARLSSRAGAGQILVSERTMRLVDHAVSGRPIDEIALKGITRPIKVYEIVSPTRTLDEDALIPDQSG